MKIRRRHWKSTWNNGENRSVIEAIRDRFSKIDYLKARIHHWWSPLSDSARNCQQKGVLATSQPENGSKIDQKYHIYANISSHKSIQLMFYAYMFVLAHSDKICTKTCVKWMKINKVKVVWILKIQEISDKNRYHFILTYQFHQFKWFNFHQTFN